MLTIHLQAIYAIRNTVNGKQYIGSTSNVDARKEQHFRLLRRGQHHSSILQRAYNKYGEGAFVFEILEVISKSKSLVHREQHYFDTLKPEYNVSLIADENTRLGLTNSPEHRARISQSNMGRPGTNKGKKFTDEHKRKISASHIGKDFRGTGWHQTQATKDKLRLHHNPKSNPPKSDQAKEKISQANIKRWASYTPERRKEIRDKVSLAQTIIKETACVVCNKKFEYHRQGKYIPKTCPICLTKKRKEILIRKNEALLAVGKGPRKIILKKSVCVICGNEFMHRSKGKENLKTCSPDCLDKLKHQSRPTPKKIILQLETESNSKTKEVCEWIKTRGGVPLCRSDDLNEKELGRFIGSKRQALAGRSTVLFYESDQIIVESYGYPDLFKLNNPELNSNRMCTQTCKWIKSNGKYPTTRSKDHTEYQLAEWVHQRRRAKKNNGPSKFYLSDQAIAESYELSNLFITKERKIPNEIDLHQHGGEMTPFQKWFNENKNSDELLDSYREYKNAMKQMDEVALSFQDWSLSDYLDISGEN